MKTRICLVALGLFTASSVWSAGGINYDGTTLELNNDFTRTECGTMAKKTMAETSGLAASRTTSGYLWAHGDENLDENRKLVAVTPEGKLTMTLNISTSGSDRDDWEDIATGRYEGKNYIFIGAIGDNDLQFKDKYDIFFFEEPSIAEETRTVQAKYIRFGYPDGKAHNTETLMYDNIEQMFYIADKIDGGVCHLYKLPFRTDYGTAVQTLTEVCALGNGSVFDLCTGGDITPDGKWMAIKNKQYILLWERQGSESLSETAKRRPQQIAAYKEEKQGESLAWSDTTTFYTTSDQKKDMPIYKYTRGDSPIVPPDTTQTDTVPEDPQVTPPALYEVMMSNAYSAYVDGSDLKALYLAGSEVPTISTSKVNEGTKWEQNGNTITLTGSDETTISYTLVTEAVTPVAFTDQEIVFDGSADEAEWLKAAYGWDDTKKWRFSKTDNDYSREIAGKTHVELFLPACDTVVLTSMNTERDVRIAINGVPFGDKVKLVKAGLSLAVNRSEPFMLTVSSAQSSGDGGIAAVRMIRKAPQGIEETQSNEKTLTTKFLYNGQLLILRGGHTYNTSGQLLQVKP